jgi:hypothetical protein
VAFFDMFVFSGAEAHCLVVGHLVHALFGKKKKFLMRSWYSSLYGIVSAPKPI